MKQSKIAIVAIELLLVMLLVAASGCSSVRDITGKTGDRTDYVAGQTYELKQPLFFEKPTMDSPEVIPTLFKLGRGGTAQDLETFKRQIPTYSKVAGVLSPGDKIRVEKFVQMHFPNVGTFLQVYAVVVSGEYAGKMVDCWMISTNRGRSRASAYVDPQCLVPVALDSK